MLKLLPEWLNIGAGVALGAMLATYPAILVGRHEGRQQAATEALESAVKRFAQKGKINGQVSSLDAAALCADFGLPDSDKADCMRRVREASTKP
jgi:hypothetical protein